MKPDEYKRARSLICKSFGIDYCKYCPLYDVDNCYEQTDEAAPWYKGFYRKPGESWHPITGLNWWSVREEAEKDLAQYARMNELKEM